MKIILIQNIKIAFRIIVFVFIVEIIVLLFLVHSLYQYKKYKQVNKENHEKLSSYIVYEHFRKKTYSKIMFTTESKMPQISLVDHNNKELKIKQISKGPKLVYRFFETSCPPCVDNDLKIIKALQDSIGENKIIIISKFKKNREFQAYMSRISLTKGVYNFSHSISMSMENDTNDVTPYFFIISKDHRVIFPYYSTPDDSISSTYFSRVISAFKNKDI